MWRSVNAYDNALREAVDIDRSPAYEHGAGAFAGYARGGASENQAHRPTGSSSAYGNQVGLARLRRNEEDVFRSTVNDAHVGVRNAMQVALASAAHLFRGIAQPTRPVGGFQSRAPGVVNFGDAQREQARPVAAEPERGLQSPLGFLRSVGTNDDVLKHPTGSAGGRRLIRFIRDLNISDGDSPHVLNVAAFEPAPNGLTYADWGSAAAAARGCHQWLDRRKSARRDREKRLA
jgi:hypothetical protein